MLDIHPSDLCNSEYDRKQLLINLNIEKEYESYLVSGVFNLLDEKVSRTLDFKQDLHLFDGDYLVYDFYRDEFLGKLKDGITLENLPYECRILSVRPYSGVPQIVSTSRHITQGAAEISSMEFKNNTLTFRASLIKGDEYSVKLYIPDGYKLKGYTGFEKHELHGHILSLTVTPEKTEDNDLSVSFYSRK